MEMVAAPTKVSVIADKINNGLEAFELRKSELAVLRYEAYGLKIESIEDKETINKVSVIRKKLKAARVEIQNEGKAMRDPLTEISRSISAKEKELVAIIEPTESELEKQENWVKSEKERIRQEEEEAHRQRMQKRIDSLALYGYSIDYKDITSISDETFGKYLEQAKIQHEREQAEKEEAERLRIEEEARLNREREEEAVRLKAEREELERFRREQQEREEKIRADQEKVERERQQIEAEQRRLKNEAENRLWRSRLEQLDNVGWDSQEAFSRADESIVATYDQLTSWSDEEFDAVMEKNNAAAAEWTAKQKRIEDERKAEDARKEIERISLLQKEAAAKALKDKEEADRLAKEREAERQAMLSDKEKFEVLYKELRGIILPEMKSTKAKKIIAQVAEIITNAAEHIQVNVLKNK